MSEVVDPSAVAKAELFAGLDDEGVACAVRNMRTLTLAPEQVLFDQGDTGHTVYVVVSGALDVFADAADGRHHLAALEPGAILGHLGLLVDAPRSATVVARTDAELWEVERRDLLNALDAGEIWAVRFLLAAARQLAVLLGSVSKQVVQLVESASKTHPDGPSTRVVEVEELRRRLMREWTF